MRNYRELTTDELAELERLYPITTNRELQRMFDVSKTSIQKFIAYPKGWKKDRKAVAGGGTRKPALDEKGLAWLKKHFQHTRNIDIMDRLNIGESQLHRYARQYGLKKSRQYLKKMNLKSRDASADVSQRYGVWEENSRRAKRQWECAKAQGKQFGGFRPGESNKTRFSARTYKKIVQKIVESRKKTIQMERARLIWGLPRKTRLNIVVMKKYTKSQTAHRYNAHQRGYILADDCREGSGTRYTIFYDEKTQRTDRFEKNLRKDGFKIMPWTE